MVSKVNINFNLRTLIKNTNLAHCFQGFFMSCKFHVSFSRWTTTILKNNADIHRFDWSEELQNKIQNVTTEY